MKALEISLRAWLVCASGPGGPNGPDDDGSSGSGDLPWLRVQPGPA